MSYPLKCTSPADVYLLLKSSDFVSSDIDRKHLFEGCEDYDASVEGEEEVPYELEMVLRKWYPFETSREVRCFVRNGILLGEECFCWRKYEVLIGDLAISQRDNSHYDFWNEQATQEKVLTTVQEFWQEHIRNQWDSSQDCEFATFLSPWLLMTSPSRYLRPPPNALARQRSYRGLQPIFPPNRPAPLHL